MAKLPGVHRQKQTTSAGKTIHYHRLGRGVGAITFWKSTDKIREGSAAYLTAYKKALGAEKARHSTGTFAQVIVDYLDSPEFDELKPRTQRDIRTSLFCDKGIDFKFGRVPLRIIEDPKGIMREQVIQWRNENFNSNRTRDARVAHLVAIMNWAVEAGKLKVHHCKGIKRLYKVDRSGDTWTPAEIASMLEDDVPVHVRRIILGAYLTGFAPAELVRLRLSEHLEGTKEGRRLIIHRAKTDEPQSVPVDGDLAELIDSTPEGQDHLIVGAKGAPYKKAEYLSPAVLPWRRLKGVRDKLHLYDLRGTRATELLNSGLELADMAMVMGWSINTASQIVEKYARVDPNRTDAIARKLRRQ